MQAPCEKPTRAMAGSARPAPRASRDRRLDGLQRPSQPRLVVLHRVVEAARIPRAPGRAGQDVGHLVVEREALRGLEHELGVLVAAVDEDRGDSGVGIAGAHQLGAEMRVAVSSSCAQTYAIVMRTVVRRAHASRPSRSADGAVVRRALLGERVGDRVRRLDQRRQDPPAQVVERHARDGGGDVEGGDRVRRRGGSAPRPSAGRSRAPGRPAPSRAGATRRAPRAGDRDR